MVARIGKGGAMAPTATLIIDMLNPYDHEDAEVLAEHAESRIEPMRALIDATAADDDAELVYVNDNFEDFTATSKDLGAIAMDGRRPDLVEPILPPKGALFVQKVRHSAFYNSALDHLLSTREVEAVILAGQVTEQCILYSALDAYVRGFTLRVAEDAVVPIDPELGDAALRMMERNMSAELGLAAELIGS
jgi:nicotinamidase-related amidase